MTKILWDQVGERKYETGIDHGVLYRTDGTGAYVTGVPWNGLTTVTESPAGAESNKQYADNTVYVNLLSAETFGGTVEAFTYPDEFAECDGTYEPTPGVAVNQQPRKAFGLCYRSLIGNDIEGQEAGYKLHLVYGCLAAPSEKAYATVNDSPEAAAFSWTISTTPVPVTGHKPTALIVIDSTKVDAAKLSDLEDLLYGTSGTDAQLPMPDDVIALFEGSVTEVVLTAANAPSYNSGTHVVTLPTVAGVTWRVNGVVKTPGAQPAMTTGQRSVVTASLAPGYVFGEGSDDDWVFDY